MARKKKLVGDAPLPVPIGANDERRWRARSAFDDMKRVDEHKQDSGLMREVRKHARDQVKAAQRIARMEKKDVPV